MRTLAELQAAGYQVQQKMLLDREDPGRKVAGDNRFLDDDVTQLNPRGKSVDAESLQQAREAIQGGDIVVLSSEDYPAEPHVTRYTERQGELRYGGPGGYPYRPVIREAAESITLTELARQLTAHPGATWAIRPQVSSYPDRPELFLLVPVAADGSNAVDASVAERLVFGRFGEPLKPAKERPAEGVRIEGDKVIIGGLSIDRRHYVIVASSR